MFGFIKKNVLTKLTILSSVNRLNAVLLNTTPFKCIPMTNQDCYVKPEILNVNSNRPVFYTFNIKPSKCSGSCNNTNNPHAKLCVPDVVKNLNVEVFNIFYCRPRLIFQHKGL